MIHAYLGPYRLDSGFFGFLLSLGPPIHFTSALMFLYATRDDDNTIMKHRGL